MNAEKEAASSTPSETFVVRIHRPDLRVPRSRRGFGLAMYESHDVPIRFYWLLAYPSVWGSSCSGS